MAKVVAIALICLPVASFAFLFPWHASCKVEWNFAFNCPPILNRIAGVIDRWQGPEGCINGGEKCLYKLISRTDKEIKATHETPKKHYVDDLTFSFFNKTEGGCTVKGYSRSETWYALLDRGTNYCNLHNIIIGADLNRDPLYKEETSDSICTQYSKANCTVY